MKPAAFDMVRPETLEEALRVLAANADDAKLLAGGQSLVPTMNFRLAAPKVLIDLNRVSGLSGVRRDGDWLRVGAMTRQAELLENPLVAAHAPLLKQALVHVGHVQTRSRGTIGGSIVHADPSAELPLVMTVLDAVYTIERAGWRRTAKTADFFIDALVTGIDADEILTEIAIPLAPDGARHEFREYARRHGDFAIVAVACQYAPPGLAIGIGGLEAVPRRCRVLEAALAERRTEPQELSELIQAELAAAHPLSDLQAGGDYRRQLAAVLVADVLAEVLGA
jgi:CO/xanthine dehydrogenase FAD-binding subunit